MIDLSSVRRNPETHLRIHHARGYYAFTGVQQFIQQLSKGSTKIALSSCKCFRISRNAKPIICRMFGIPWSVIPMQCCGRIPSKKGRKGRRPPMGYVSQKDIKHAKQMDLMTYLQNYEPHEIVRISDGVYCTREHDSLKISNGKWCWWSHGIGGRTALDYLIKVKGYSFIRAVEQIIGQAAITPSAFISAPIKDKKLLLPDLCKYPKRAKTYLISRGINEEIIDFCIANGSIREDALHHNVLFIGFDKSNEARYCAVRSTIGNFKVDATGSDKHYSFKLLAKEPNNTLHLFESAIDLLSYATLLKCKQDDWQNENLLSLAGIYQPQKDIHQSKVPMALSQYLKDYPQIERVVFHLDNDKPGRLATHAIRTVLPSHYQTSDVPPPTGKDFNEYLQIKLGKCNKNVERSERG